MLQAYQQLEDQGYIRAKAKSGYVVLPRRNTLFAGNLSAKVIKPYPVKISDLLYDVLQRAKDPRSFHLVQHSLTLRYFHTKRYHAV